MIPNLPTDNLYKLLTIMGLALMVGSAYLFAPFGRSIIPEMRKGAATAYVLNHRLRAAGLDAKLLPERLSAIGPYNLYSENDALIQTLPRGSENLLALQKMNEDVYLERTRQWSLETERDINKMLMITGFIVGLAFFLMGFHLWNRNFQRYQDLLALQQYKIALYDVSLKELELLERSQGQQRTDEAKVAGGHGGKGPFVTT